MNDEEAAERDRRAKIVRDADEHERKAVSLSSASGKEALSEAAVHFTIAAGLRRSVNIR